MTFYLEWFYGKKWNSWQNVIFSINKNYFFIFLVIESEFVAKSDILPWNLVYSKKKKKSLAKTIFVVTGKWKLIPTQKITSKSLVWTTPKRLQR